MDKVFAIAKILKSFPTIMHIQQEIKIMHYLEDLNISEIIEGIEIFLGILNNLEISHWDNFVMEDDVKTVMEYKKFIKWLEKIKEIEEIKDYSVRIDSIIDIMGLYYPKSDHPSMGKYSSEFDNMIEKIFTNEELEYMYISDLFQRKFNGKNYIFIYLDNDNNGIWTDENKMVYKI